MVRGDAALQIVLPVEEAEDPEILIPQVAGAVFDDRADLRALLSAREPDAGATHLLHGTVAARAAEDEEDRREEVRPLQQAHDVRSVDPLHACGARPALIAVRAPPALCTGILGATVVLEVLPLEGAHAHQFLIHLRGRRTRSLVEQRQEIAAHEHVLLQRHRAGLRDDHRGVAADGVEPVAELLRVRDRGAQRDDLHLARQVDDDLLPHGAAEAIGEVVHLVHHHVAEVRQRLRVRVQHVAQHLGGHHDDACIAVDVGVAGEEPHLVGAVDFDELPELLVRQRLHGSRVERLLAGAEHREMDRELPHDRLAGARRRGDQHAVPVFQRLAAGDLEGIEGEALDGGETSRLRVRGRVLRPRVPVRR